MYFRSRLTGGNFIYFWTSKNTAVNNDREGKTFGRPFTVDPENCKGWRKSSKSDMIAPEILTYWSKDNAL